MADASKCLYFDGKPLVKIGQLIIYGNIYDPYYCRMKILSTKNENGVEVPDELAIGFFTSDAKVDKSKRLIYQLRCHGMQKALTRANAWFKSSK